MASISVTPAASACWPEGADLLLDEIEPAGRGRVAGDIGLAAPFERCLEDLDHRSAAGDHRHATGRAARTGEHVDLDLGAEERT